MSPCITCQGGVRRRWPENGGTSLTIGDVANSTEHQSCDDPRENENGKRGKREEGIASPGLTNLRANLRNLRRGASRRKVRRDGIAWATSTRPVGFCHWWLAYRG